MRNLIQPPPSMHCELCDGELRFKRIEPDDPAFDMEVEIFVCSKCGHVHSLPVMVDWKNGDREMAAVAEVIASAFASGMSWAGTIEGHPLYCLPPIGAFTGNQAMSILESFIPDHPETADKTYGLALSASLRQAFPCAPT